MLSHIQYKFGQPNQQDNQGTTKQVRKVQVKPANQQEQGEPEQHPYFTGTGR
jgi:hypothetical protein